MRTENIDREVECYQVDEGVRAIYDDLKKVLVSLEKNGNPVEDNKYYTICLQGHHFNNSANYLNITNKELLDDRNHKVITTSAQEALEEYLRNNQNILKNVEGRLIYK